MERRLSLRGRTDLPVKTQDGSLISLCRGIELSATGIVLDRGRPVTSRDHSMLVRIYVDLPERHRPVEVKARSVWGFGSQQAFKFIRMNDVDRLNLAEHLDLMSHRGIHLN